MYVSQDMNVKETTAEDRRREYFLGRIRDISDDHRLTLQKKYGLYADHPRTPKELVEWIKSGEFTILEDQEDIEHGAYGIMDCFHWTKIKKDKKGYETASHKLTETLSLAKDEIWATTDIAELPKIVEKFQNTKLH